MAAASVATIVLGAGACASGGAPSAAPGEAPTETLAPFVLDETGGSAAPCTGAGDPGSGGPPAAAGSPLAAPGARQLPGPAVTVTTVPSAATSIVMQTPANPDEASPARQPDGVGTPTAPYVIGADATGRDPSTTTTTDDADGDDGSDPAANEPSGTAGSPSGCGGGL